MAFDTFAKTADMFVPSLGKVVPVNQADVAYLRETCGAVTKAEHEAAAKSVAAKPFKTKAEKEAAEKEAAEIAAKEAAELAAKNAAS